MAEFMARNPDAVAISSAAELAKSSGTSDATVVRTAKALGYVGLRELKRDVIETMTRSQNPANVLDDRLGRIEQDDHGFDRVMTDSIGLIQQLQRGIRPDEWHAAIDAVLGARRIVAYGIGPAAALADYLAITLNRIGLDAQALSTTGIRLADGLLKLQRHDVAFVFAPLRLFREVEALIDHAHAVGARVVVISEALGLSLTGKVDVVLATPQSTTNASSELTAGLLLAHALTLAVAAQTREQSVQTMELLNQLRERVTGHRGEAHPLDPITTG